MYLSHVSAGLTLTEVGTLFGRDRTTAAHACRLVEDLRDDPSFDRTLEQIELAIRMLLAANDSHKEEASVRRMAQ